jgi:hypothetical protein
MTESALLSNPRPAEFVVIFELTREGYRTFWFPAFGLIFVALGVAGVVYERLSRPAASNWRRALGPWALLTFSSLWTLTAGVSTYREYANLRRAVEAGAIQYVEGPVERFVPMPANGHGVEQFEVHSKHFEYSPNVVSAGFNKPSMLGGPIRAGRYVRVGYVGQTIVRLETR